MTDAEREAVIAETEARVTLEIVAWLRKQHDLDLAVSKRYPLGSDRNWENLGRAAFAGGIADAIERLAHKGTDHDD